ncbi:substrate-binding domain-containing protein [Paraburkholderia sp. CNPSo 3272]|uniref:substrate-binding domain-containing protein n=1 Tax=Paraburkholderia sp. CNPSo 3272 TaxID=2940931 RepID=UPI0020B891B9|nr:substrate-binding domain-containing protein [Paraburkholderia sp. CNPSo 3272]MCP3726465.1 substrate-binding domain-containing protein [Paraburkholderia sp. CNPSo 3272]
MTKDDVKSNAALAGVGSMATRLLLAGLAEQYERETGQRLTVAAIGGVEAARRVQAGAAFDFAVLASAAIDRLAAGGHLVGARMDVVRSGMAAAVASGAAHPDIGTEGALRETMLRAARIGYSTGPSGDHLLRLVERWGVAETLRPRLVMVRPGVPVASLIAAGEVEIGFQQLSELKDVPGVDVIGPLPAGAQLVTVFSAAICAVSQQRQAAADFLAFLGSARAEATKRAFGMEPAGNAAYGP